MRVDDLELEGLLRIIQWLEGKQLDMGRSTALQFLEADADLRLLQMLIDRRVLKVPPCWDSSQYNRRSDGGST